MRLSDVIRDAADKVEKVEDRIERWWNKASATAGRMIDYLLFSLNALPGIFLLGSSPAQQLVMGVAFVGFIVILEILRRSFNTESLPASTS